MPEEFAFLISAALCHHQSASMGLYLIVLFCTFLRPSASLRLHFEEIVKLVKKVAREHWVLMIARFEREMSTMTGYFDGSVVLDDDVLPGLGQLLYDQAQGRAFALGHTAGTKARFGLFNVEALKR